MTPKQSPRLQISSCLGSSEPDLDQHISLPGAPPRCMERRSVEVYTNLLHLQHPLERNSTSLPPTVPKPTFFHLFRIQFLQEASLTLQETASSQSLPLALHKVWFWRPLPYCLLNPFFSKLTNPTLVIPLAYTRSSLFIFFGPFPVDWFHSQPVYTVREGELHTVLMLRANSAFMHAKQCYCFALHSFLNHA